MIVVEEIKITDDFLMPALDKVDDMFILYNFYKTTAATSHTPYVDVMTLKKQM